MRRGILIAVFGLLLLVLSTGCSVMQAEQVDPLTPLVPPATTTTTIVVIETTAPPTTTIPMQLAPVPTLYAPGTEFEMTPEQFFETFGVWPTCDAVTTQDWACLAPEGMTP